MQLKNVAIECEDLVSVALSVARCMAARRTVRGYEIEDMVQDILADVVRDIDNCRASSREQFAGWCKRVASNTIGVRIAMVTAKKRTAVVVNDFDVADSMSTAEELAIAAESRAAVARLHDGNRLVTLMERGVTDREFAEQERISLHAAAGRYKRFRKKAAKLLRAQ